MKMPKSEPVVHVQIWVKPGFSATLIRMRLGKRATEFNSFEIETHANGVMSLWGYTPRSICEKIFKTQLEFMVDEKVWKNFSPLQVPPRLMHCVTAIALDRVECYAK